MSNFICMKSTERMPFNYQKAIDGGCGCSQGLPLNGGKKAKKPAKKTAPKKEAPKKKTAGKKI
jgi:hypothetical protein